MAAFERKPVNFKRDGAGFTRKAATFSRKKMPDNPLDRMEYTGDPEADSKKEGDLTLEALRNKELQKEIRDKLRVMTDSEFWCALCFETHAQKDAFLQAVGVYNDGDKYIDGVDFARRLGIDLPKSDVHYRPAAKPNKNLLNFVKD
jgi:hypothetical protein